MVGDLIDAHLPGGPMTVEAFIVPLSADWVLELSLPAMGVKEEYEALARSLLANLRVQEGSACVGQTAF